MLTFGSLFAGIGGFDLGLERAGMQVKWQVEIDPFCQKVLTKHWPNVERFSDVRDCGKHNLAAVDLVCGGFPCQPHSVAGKRGGAADDRDLWPEMRRIVDELRPAWVLAENVPGIRGTILDDVLSDLEALAYEVGAVVVPACGVGAPHKRERVWIVAHAERPERRTDKPEPRPEGRMSELARMGEHRPVVGLDVAHTNGSGLQGYGVSSASLLERPSTTVTGEESEQADSPVAHANVCADDKGIAQSIFRAVSQPTVQGRHNTAWDTEPDVGRVAHGVRARVDRLRALGNAVVPQVVEWLGRRIVAADGMHTPSGAT